MPPFRPIEILPAVLVTDPLNVIVVASRVTEGALILPPPPIPPAEIVTLETTSPTNEGADEKPPPTEIAAVTVSEFDSKFRFAVPAVLVTGLFI
jgi:hypothetical protein